MFDTMRFKIPGTVEIYKAIKAHGFQRLMWDYVADTQVHVLVYQLLPVNRRFYKIYIQAQDYEHFFLEFSLPKLLFDTNIFMIYPNNVLNILLMAHRAVDDFLVIKIPQPHEWIVQRVDYDQVWKFETREQAKWVLESLKQYTYPRKGITIWDTSLEIDGTTEKIIAYLKQDEFMDKSYAKLVKSGNERLANFLKEASANVLRFEISQKKAKLNSIFGREVTYKDVIERSYVESVLNTTLQTLCGTENLVSMTYNDVVFTIYSKLNAREAYNLFGFFNMWYAPELATRDFNRDFLKRTISYTTIHKNKAKLEELGVGIMVTNPMFNAFDLSIPSKNVINTAEQVAEIAKAIGDLRVL